MAPGRSKADLIVYLRDRKSCSFGEIAERVGMSKNGVWNIYKRAKETSEPLRRGRPRKPDPRAVLEDAYNAITGDTVTNAAELCLQLELAHSSVQTVQRRLREIMTTEHRAELLKNLIVRLHEDDGWTFRRIADHLNMSKSGVFGIYKSTRNPAEPAPLGRKRSTDERTDRMIVRECTNDPFSSAAEIRDNLRLSHVSVRTVQRRLQQFGLHGRRPATKPFISPKNVRERIQFARQHLPWSNEWRGVLWSDESKFNMCGSDGRQWVRRPARDRFKPKYTKSSVKCGGGNIMVWGCFSYYGLGPLHLIRGTMDRFGYKRILEEVMSPHLQTLEAELPDVNWIFQQDNDPKHKSIVVSEWFQENGIITLPWPAQSPDLNPIENLWAEVERRLGRRSFTKPEELFAAVRSAWESIPVERLQGLVDSMPRRCKAVIDAGGYATKY